MWFAYGPDKDNKFYKIIFNLYYVVVVVRTIATFLKAGSILSELKMLSWRMSRNALGKPTNE